MRISTKTAVSLEAIAYIQNDPFIDEMVKLIEQLRLLGDYGTKAIHESGIQDCINKRFKTNFTVMVIDSAGLDAAISVPPISANHPFYALFPKRRRNTIGDLLVNVGEKGNRIGKIDLSKLELSGVYSKIPTTIILTAGLLKDKNITPRQLLGAIAHEIGHFFFYLFHLTNATMSNFVTNAIAAECAGANSDDERTMILEKGSRILGVDGVKINTLLTSKEEDVSKTLQVLYIDNVWNNIRSETGASLYEIRANEQMADYFASRLGLGADLIMGLEKMWRGNGLRFMAQRRQLILANVIVASMKLALSLTGVGLVFLLNDVLNANSPDVRRYDTPKQRIEMMRQYVIQALKEDRFNKDKNSEQLLKDIDELQKVADRIQDVPTVTEWLVRRLNKRARSISNTVQTQKEIEALLYNDIYVNAAKFAQLSKS